MNKTLETITDATEEAADNLKSLIDRHHLTTSLNLSGKTLYFRSENGMGYQDIVNSLQPELRSKNISVYLETRDKTEDIVLDSQDGPGGEILRRYREKYCSKKRLESFINK